MTRAIDTALRAMFSDPNIARDALYQPARGGPRSVRAIFRAPDRIGELEELQLIARAVEVEVLASDVQTPQVGDVLRFADAGYAVASEPMLDAERKIWRLLLVPRAGR